MIPFVAMVSVRGKESRTFRFWIPLILIWLLLIPLFVILLPFVLIACLVCQINPFQGIAVLWQILSALRQSQVEFENRSAGMSFYVL